MLQNIAETRLPLPKSSRGRDRYCKIVQHYLPATANVCWKYRQCLESRLRVVLSRIMGILERHLLMKNCIIRKNNIDKKDIYVKAWIVNPFATRTEARGPWSKSFCRICFDRLRKLPETSPCRKMWVDTMSTPG
jgi:hypothetical protein